MLGVGQDAIVHAAGGRVVSDGRRRAVVADRRRSRGGLSPGLRRGHGRRREHRRHRSARCDCRRVRRARIVAARRRLVRRAGRALARMSAARCTRSTAPIRCRSIRTSGCLRRSMWAACWFATPAALQRAFCDRRRLHRRDRRSRHVGVCVLGSQPRAVAPVSRAEDLVPAEVHGARAIQEAIDGNIAVARHLATLIEQSDDFELLAPAPLSIVCFRLRAGDATPAGVV